MVEVPEERLVCIVGTPRSGTRYLTRVLQNAGLEIGHEKVRPFSGEPVKSGGGCVTCWYGADTQGGPGRHSYPRSHWRFTHVWHLVRHPLRTIRSMPTGVGSAWWKFQREHTGVSYHPGPDEIEQSGHFWVAWNELIEQWDRVSWLIPIEKIDDWWPSMTMALGIHDKALPGVPRNFGEDRKRYHPLKWADLKGAEKSVRELAMTYGYSMDELPEVLEAEEAKHPKPKPLIRAADDWRR